MYVQGGVSKLGLRKDYKVEQKIDLSKGEGDKLLNMKEQVKHETDPEIIESLRKQILEQEQLVNRIVEENRKVFDEAVKKSIFRPVDQAILQNIENVRKNTEPVKKGKKQSLLTNIKLKLYEHKKKLVMNVMFNFVKSYNGLKNDDRFYADLKGMHIHMETEHHGRKRFTVIHDILKTVFVYPALKLLGKKLGKYMVQRLEDIPDEWQNNHHRMWYNAWEQGLLDMWYYFRYEPMLKSGRYTKSFNEYLIDSKTITGQSHRGRQMAVDLWMTEILEDTVDREWFNMAIMRLTHNMMKHYGVSENEMNKVPKPGEFPIYDVNVGMNPRYFFLNHDKNVWKHDIKEDRLACQKKRVREIKIVD